MSNEMLRMVNEGWKILPRILLKNAGEEGYVMSVGRYVSSSASTLVLFATTFVC